MELARFLKEEREKRGLSKLAVAERAGLSDPMIGFVESASRHPTVQTLLRIADALGIDAADALREAQRRAK